MFTKLTLNIFTAAIEKAKITARKKRASLSRLLEIYFKKRSAEKDGSFVLSIINNALAGKTNPGTEKAFFKKSLIKNYGP